MVKTTLVQNKALVLQAFDTLFNKRDYEAVERSAIPDCPSANLHFGLSSPICLELWPIFQTFGRVHLRSNAANVVPAGPRKKGITAMTCNGRIRRVEGATR